MKQPKHTPGPWRVERHDGKTEIWSQNHFVARVDDALFMSAKKHGLEDGNARLIAAAPEMLEALASALNFINGYGEQTKAGIIYEIKSAIAKARGES